MLVLTAVAEVIIGRFVVDSMALVVKADQVFLFLFFVFFGKSLFVI